MGKGDRPRNVGPKFKANFQDIYWGNDDSANWFVRKSTKRVYHYGHRFTRGIELSPVPLTNQD
jgi:hypothetical protein